MKRLTSWWFVATCLVVGALQAAAAKSEPRFAIVIGNTDYEGSITRTLKYPRSDIGRVGEALRRVGFEVRYVPDKAKSVIEAEIKNFANDLRSNKGSVGFFYFSGHGTQVRDDDGIQRNYLIALPEKEKAPVSDLADIRRDGIDVDDIIETVSRDENKKPLRDIKAIVFVLDACRSELQLPQRIADSALPLSDREVGSKGFFARPELPRVSILYGAAANQTSPDDGKLSAFLQDEIAQPGQNHIKALLNVSQSLTVARHEGKIQLKPTVTFGEFPSEFCFVSCSDGDTAKAANADNTEQVVRYRTAFDGRALLKDELSTKSIQELERAAAKGDARSLYLLAIEGWNRAPEAARENMLRSVLADNKNELSKRQVAAYGQMLLDGVGGDKSAREAQLWWKAGDRLGCPRCAYLLGDYYEDTKLYAEAFRYYEKAMNGGVLDAQAAIGDMYWWGKGVRLSQSKAVEIYKKASKSGSARGQFRLAGHHRFGTASLWDVPLDQPRARDLYVQASKLGHQQAAIEAAIMYSDGEGIPTDAAAAAALLLDPVNDNNWEAMSLLAGLLIKERIPAIKGLDPLHLAEEADKHDYPDALSSLVFSLRSDTKGRKGNLTLAAKLARGGLARAEARTTDMDAGWPLHAKNFAFAIQKALAQGLPEAGLGEGDRLKKKYGKVDGPFKQLTVPVLCGAEKVPMSVYVWDAPDEPNPPTDGQFDWAEEARACKVDVVVRKAFRDLFAIAKRENVSFTELIFYALYLAQKESSANAL